MNASPEEAPTFRYPDGSVFYRDLERTYRIAKRAAGAWIEADDGSRWLDACGGALTISVGHGRPEVVQAAAGQLNDLAYVHGAQFTTAAMEEAAALLVDSLPPAYRNAKVYLTPGGAEAVETAIKLARAHALAGG
ncbi:MAG: aminotransferase class III-fold pyridoxal phosphate-dependent enzyme, partial [Acidobacteriota bacterium]|nr:aminotransferase class III-fold pyridoxal phosphate-dependent enzyme [Acidobacteriota bacterium]